MTRHGIARFLSCLSEAAWNSKPISKTLEEARKQIPHIHDWNLRISSFGRHGDIRGARNLFDEMPQRDGVSYSIMISLYLKTGDLPNAEKLFGNIPESNVVVESAMVHALSVAGRIAEARRLFDGMCVRNVLTWTGLLSGYCHAGRIDDAEKLFAEMPERNIVSWTVMIKAYADAGRIEDAGELFDKMPQRNLYSWNAMIKGCLRCRKIGTAINLFESMPRRNVITWTIMASGLAENDMIDDAQKLFDQTPAKDIASWNAMIAAYAGKGRMEAARRLFDSSPEKNIITWNAMIDGYARNGSHVEAVSMLILMLRMQVNPNESSLTSLVAGCDSLTAGAEVHGSALKLGFTPDTCLANALVFMYSRNGDLRAAWLAFDELKAKDAVSWTSMILAFANHGCGICALKAFAKMLRNGDQPDEVTFIGVLSACSHAGLVEKGVKIFGSMARACGVEPKAEHHSCLVDILGRAGRVCEANLAMSKVPRGERDAAVLGACKTRRAAEELIEMEEESCNGGSFVFLANSYAARGEWGDVARVRKMMRDRRVEKVPGFSQIDLKMRRYVFFAADRTHSQHQQIYEMLEHMLYPQMKDHLLLNYSL